MFNKIININNKQYWSQQGTLWDTTPYRYPIREYAYIVFPESCMFGGDFQFVWVWNKNARCYSWWPSKLSTFLVRMQHWEKCPAQCTPLSIIGSYKNIQCWCFLAGNNSAKLFFISVYCWIWQRFWHFTFYDGCASRPHNLYSNWGWY